MLETTTGGDVRYANLHGDQVAYREAGSGEVVLLIHGMAGSSESWGSVFSSLARTHRVVAPDLLGHGRSDKPRGDYSLGAFAAGLRDLLDQLDISQATIVGHSLGGGVAMQFLYQHPDYCRRLVLVSSGGLGPDVGWILRMLSAPGVELAFPFIAPRPSSAWARHCAPGWAPLDCRRREQPNCGGPIRHSPTGRPDRHSCGPCGPWSTTAVSR